MQTNHDTILVLLKSALDFNASIVALATLYVGNTNTEKNAKKFLEEYNDILAIYEKIQSNVIAEMRFTEPSQ